MLEESLRPWPEQLLHPILDSMARPHGMGFLVHGAPRAGKTAFLRDLRRGLMSAHPGSALTSTSQMVRWSRLKLGERRYLQCRIAFEEWRDHPAMPLQGVLAAELTASVPNVALPLSSAFFTRGEFAELLAHGGWDGLVILGDDLDRFLLQPERASRRFEDRAFLEELGGMIAVYLLPVWVVCTVTEALPQAEPGRLRDRFTSLHLDGR
ncbi:MAG: hypothetical protein ACYCW6_01290 [Candidatus Xenobia bacterium]